MQPFLWPCTVLSDYIICHPDCGMWSVESTLYSHIHTVNRWGGLRYQLVFRDRWALNRRLNLPFILSRWMNVSSNLKLQVEYERVLTLFALLLLLSSLQLRGQKEAVCQASVDSRAVFRSDWGVPVSMCGSMTEAVHVFIEGWRQGVSIVGLW